MVADIGKLLLIVGGIIMVMGAVLLLAGGFNLPVGRLPGDIVIRGKNTVFYFPLATSILLSLVLSLILWFLNRGHR